jgi:hypothetical protein
MLRAGPIARAHPVRAKTRVLSVHVREDLDGLPPIFGGVCTIPSKREVDTKNGSLVALTGRHIFPPRTPCAPDCRPRAGLCKSP